MTQADLQHNRLPPGQQLAAPGKWPTVGERLPPPHDGPWSVQITGCAQSEAVWTIDELLALPQIRQVVDIHCVTRWSKLDVTFSGVPLAQLLDIVQPTKQARFVSFVAHSDRGHSTSLALDDAFKLDTLIALRCQGQPISAERGGPVRVVVPRRYFYKSLKWLRRIELLPEDRLGFWEATAGYHNHADPWLEQRYIASGQTRKQTAALLQSRDMAGQQLLSLNAAGHDLQGLRADGAQLRNADFCECRLQNASFQAANLSNAAFRNADLRHASFRDADVEGADFSGADLREVDLRGGSFLGTTFVTSAGTARIDHSTRFSGPALDQLAPRQSTFVAGRASLE